MENIKQARHHNRVSYNPKFDFAIFYGINKPVTCNIQSFHSKVVLFFSIMDTQVCVGETAWISVTDPAKKSDGQNKP